MDQKTKMVLDWDLHEQSVSNSQIARRLEANRDTINGWICDITEHGARPPALFGKSPSRQAKTTSGTSGVPAGEAEGLAATRARNALSWTENRVLPGDRAWY